MPAVEPYAKQLQVDLNLVKTGPNGQITAEDVKKHPSNRAQSGKVLRGVRHLWH